MGKWFGHVGFSETKETAPGVWTEVITERSYRGDVIRDTRRLQSSDQVNSNLNIAVEISIVSDSYSYEKFQYIRYVEYLGTKWEVTSAIPQRPRINLSIGGVYNGRTS